MEDNNSSNTSEPNMRARAVTIDISPSTKVDQGCGSRATDINLTAPQEKLEANLLALWIGSDSTPLLVVTLDLLYPGKIIENLIQKTSGIPASNILVASSHTHAAPMTDQSKPGLGGTDSDYIGELLSNLQAAVRDVLNSRNAVEVKLLMASGSADHSVNRRRRQQYYLGRRMRGPHIALAPNFSGSRDESLILGTLVDRNSRVIAYIWNYACHPVGHPTPFKNSPHYVGAVRNALRKEESSAVLFLQGFSGDTRPSGTVSDNGIFGQLRNAGFKHRFSSMSPETYEHWKDSLVSMVIGLVSELQHAEVSDFRTSRKSLPGNLFSIGRTEPVTFQAWRFGNALTIVSASAEVVSTYANFVRELTEDVPTMCVGCVGDVYGYLPTSRMVREGGYEGGEFCSVFGLGSLTTNIESVAKQAFADTIFSVCPTA